MRILFFGMEGVFSPAPLVHLLQSEFTVCGVVVPAPRNLLWPDAPSLRRLAPPRLITSDLPLLMAPPEKTVVGLAWDADVPMFEVRRLKRAETLAALAALQPDALAVACFPRLLPPALLDLAPHRAFNVHPSRLPQYRGPEPLFWTFHDELDHAAVTIHLMDAGADSGPIAAQTPVHLPDGIGYEQAQRLGAEVGAHLLLSVLRASRDGTLALYPQSEEGASAAPVPGPEDFVITPQWSARRAYNFARGVTEWRQPIVFDTGPASFIIREAVGFRLDNANGTSAQEASGASTLVSLRCADGALLARV